MGLPATRHSPFSPIRDHEDSNSFDSVGRKLLTLRDTLFWEGQTGFSFTSIQWSPVSRLRSSDDRSSYRDKKDRGPVTVFGTEKVLRGEDRIVSQTVYRLQTIHRLFLLVLGHGRDWSFIEPDRLVTYVISYVVTTLRESFHVSRFTPYPSPTTSTTTTTKRT